MGDPIDPKQQFIDLKNHYRLKIDELETLLDYESKDKKRLETQLSEQLSTIRELRRIRDNSVELIEFQTLSNKYEELDKKCLDLKSTIDTLNKRLSSETNENEFLHKKIEEKEEEINRLQTNINNSQSKVEELNQKINCFKDLNEKVIELQNQLENEKIENLRLNELIIVCREEHLKHNESNISVEDLNQSISKFLNSFNNSCVGESMDCVLNIKLSELEEKFEEKRKEYELLSDLNEESNKEVAKLKIICSELEDKVQDLTKSCNNFVKEKEVLLESVEKEKENFMKANEEIKEMQSVVDKRFDQFRQHVSILKQSLTAEQQRAYSLEEELQKYKKIESKQIDAVSEGYEKMISELKTKLSTEELSFEYERRTKERYAKENQEYAKKIQALEADNKRMKQLLDRSTVDGSATSYFSMPTTININTTQPLQHNYSNFSARSVSSMDISNANSTNLSFNISRKLPTGTGSRLAMADEEGEFMVPNHLNALKRGECNLSDSMDEERMSILQRRNTMVMPHLRSAYAVELPYLKEDVDPEDIKHGFQTFNESKALKPIQNLSYHRNQVIADRKNNSVSCDNFNINANKFNKRGPIDSIRITSSKLSLKNMTPTKMLKKMVKPKQSWTPLKK